MITKKGIKKILISGEDAAERRGVMRYLINMPYPIVASHISIEGTDEIQNLRTCMLKEDSISFSNYLNLGGAPHNIVLIDNGLLSQRGYLPAERWRRVMERVGLAGDDFFSRYDHIIHLSMQRTDSESFRVYDCRNSETASMLISCENITSIPDTGSFAERMNSVIYTFNHLIYS